MNFLNKARRKVDAAMNDMQANAQQRQSQSQSQSQPQSQYQAPTPPPPQPYQQQQQYTHQPPAQPPPQWNQNYQQQNYQQQNSYAPQSSYGYQPGASHQPPPNPSQGYYPAPPPRTGATNQERAAPQEIHLPYRPPPVELPGSEIPPSFTARKESPQESTAVPEVPQRNSLDCLARDFVFTKNTPFYLLKVHENFTTCGNCYDSFVAPHQSMTSHFAPLENLNKNEKFICDFSDPSAEYLFRNQCVPHNTIQPLLDFLGVCGTLSPCDGSVITSEGPMYLTKNDVIPGFACCPTCFELMLRYTPFEANFVSVTNDEVGQWSCDLVLPFYKRQMISELRNPSPNFQTFAENAIARLGYPECQGHGMPIINSPDAEQFLVYTDAAKQNGNICLACYADLLSGTSLEDSFVLAYLSEDQIGTIHCDFAAEYSKTAIDIAITKGDIEIWRSYVLKFGQLGPCAGQRGVDEEELLNIDREDGSASDWYQVTDYPGIEICPRCYWLQMKLLGAAHLLSPITRPLVNGMIRMCYVTHSKVPLDTSTSDANNFENTLTWRGRRIANTMDFGYETGDWSDFLSVCKTIAAEPPPCGGNVRGLKRGSGRKFFGHVYADPNDPDDLTIVMCEECHTRLIKDTPIAPIFSQNLTEEAFNANRPNGFACQPYSVRAKQHLRTAAESGDLASFARYWNKREALWKRREAWNPILANQKLKQDASNHMLSLQILTKVNAQANALMMKGGAGIAEAAMGETGVRYGNSIVGEHLTLNGANAAMAYHEASNMPVGTGGTGNITADSQMFLAQFNVDNEAWLAME